MLAVSHRAGRVIEAYGAGSVTYEEFVDFRSALMEHLARVGLGRPVVIVGDLRALEEMSPDVAPALLGMLRADNRLVERGAHLVKAGSAFQNQYQRVIGATGNPERQIFTEAQALIRWLEPVLAADEVQRLREMFGA